MTRPRIAGAVTALALTLLAAGCGDDGGAANAESSPTIADSPSSEPTADETSQDPEAIPTTYPEVGLELTDLPEFSSPRWHEALRTYVEFERGRRQLLREARMNRVLTDTSANNVVSTYRDTLSYLQDNNAHYRGDVTVVVDDHTESKKRFLALDLCHDASQLRWVENGEAEPLGGPERTRERVIVTNNDGRWLVTEVTGLDGSC